MAPRVSPEGPLDGGLPQVGDLVMFYHGSQILFGNVQQIVWPRPHEIGIGIQPGIEVQVGSKTYYPERSGANVVLKRK